MQPARTTVTDMVYAQQPLLAPAIQATRVNFAKQPTVPMIAMIMESAVLLVLVFARKALLVLIVLRKCVQLDLTLVLNAEVMVYALGQLLTAYVMKVGEGRRALLDCARMIAIIMVNVLLGPACAMMNLME